MLDLDVRPVSTRAISALIHQMVQGRTDADAIRLASSQYPGERAGLERNAGDVRVMVQAALVSEGHLSGGDRQRIAERVAHYERRGAARDCQTCAGAGIVRRPVSYGGKPVMASLHCPACAPASCAGLEVDGL